MNSFFHDKALKARTNEENAESRLSKMSIELWKNTKKFNVVRNYDV